MSTQPSRMFLPVFIGMVLSAVGLISTIPRLFGPHEPFHVWLAVVLAGLSVALAAATVYLRPPRPRPTEPEPSARHAPPPSPAASHDPGSTSVRPSRGFLALIIGMVVVGAGLIVLISTLFGLQEPFQIWATAVLTGLFAALAAATLFMRRARPGRPEPGPNE